MSDLTDSPYLARRWCPACESDRNFVEEILETQYCGLHAPSCAGAEDAGVVYGYLSSGTSEAGGEGNRILCHFLHGEARR